MIKTGNNYSVYPRSINTGVHGASTGQGEGTNVEANNTMGGGGRPVRGDFNISSFNISKTVFLLVFLCGTILGSGMRYYLRVRNRFRVSFDYK